MIRKSLLVGLSAVLLLALTVSTAFAAPGQITEVNPSPSARGQVVDVNPPGLSVADGITDVGHIISSGPAGGLFTKPFENSRNTESS